jgi:acetylornithine deacetylase
MNRPRPALREMLAQLIATPSVSSVSPEFDMGNRAVIELVAGWLDALGFAVTLHELPGHPDKLNLVAKRGNGPGGLVLAGHADTVPCDPELWRSDPFRLAERDGHYHGLGVSDMKSFFAFAVEAAARADLDGLREPLTILATCDEESGMHGARALAARHGVHGRWGVIGEPTGMRPVHRHKGIFMEAVRIAGHAGHSSDPRLGINAIDAMHRVVAELMVVRDELARAHHDPDFNVPNPTINLGRIVGGDNPNRICPSCELHFDCRLLPGMELGATREAVRARLAAAVRGTGAALAFEALFEGVEALIEVPNSALIALAESLTEQSAHAVAFSTEAPFLRALGIDTVVLGPGDIATAHQPDEWLAQDAMEPYVRVLERFIHHCCVAPTPLAA